MLIVILPECKKPHCMNDRLEFLEPPPGHFAHNETTSWSFFFAIFDRLRLRWHQLKYWLAFVNSENQENLPGWNVGVDFDKVGDIISRNSQKLVRRSWSRETYSVIARPSSDSPPFTLFPLTFVSRRKSRREIWSCCLGDRSFIAGAVGRLVGIGRLTLLATARAPTGGPRWSGAGGQVVLCCCCSALLLCCCYSPLSSCRGASSGVLVAQWEWGDTAVPQ